MSEAVQRRKTARSAMCRQCCHNRNKTKTAKSDPVPNEEGMLVSMVARNGLVGKAVLQRSACFHVPAENVNKLLSHLHKLAAPSDWLQRDREERDREAERK